MKSLPVDEPCRTVILETPVQSLDLHPAEPEDEDLLNDQIGGEHTL